MEASTEGLYQRHLKQPQYSTFAIPNYTGVNYVDNLYDSIRRIVDGQARPFTIFFRFSKINRSTYRRGRQRGFNLTAQYMMNWLPPQDEFERDIMDRVRGLGPGTIDIATNIRLF